MFWILDASLVVRQSVFVSAAAHLVANFANPAARHAWRTAVAPSKAFASHLASFAASFDAATIFNAAHVLLGRVVVMVVDVVVVVVVVAQNPNTGINTPSEAVT